MIHSRRTRAEPRGVSGAHQFLEEAVLKTGSGLERAEIYLCQNGGVDKQEVAEKICVDNPSLYVDSHLYLKYLVKSLPAETSIEQLPKVLTGIIKELRPLVKSALNLGLVVVTQSSDPLLLSVGYVVDKSPNKRSYYQPVVVRSEGLAGFISSSVKDAALEAGLNADFDPRSEDFLAEINPTRYREFPLQT